MITAASTLFMAMSCQGCAQFSGGYAATPVTVQVNATTAAFVADTALGATLESPVKGYNAYDVVPNSFNTPLYGAPPAFSETSFTESGEFSAAFNVGESVISSLEWSSSEPIEAYKAQRKAARIAEPMEIERDFSAEFAISALKENTGLDFDLGFAPRLSVRDEGDFSTRSFGAEVRLGQDFDARGTEPSKGWYVFAGADGEALVWETGERGFTDMGAMKLRDQVTVGDLQAGFAIHRGGGELSLSYIRREVEYKDRNGGFSENEDFAGVSFTLKR